jgi:hypothetical protein
MSRVSYRVMLDSTPGPRPTFRPLDAKAIATRRRDAAVRAQASFSKRQVRWLRDAAAKSGGVHPEDIIRAAVDLVMELEIDWSAVTRPSDLRDAVREAVLVGHTV